MEKVVTRFSIYFVDKELRKKQNDKELNDKKKSFYSELPLGIRYFVSKKLLTRREERRTPRKKTVIVNRIVKSSS